MQFNRTHINAVDKIRNPYECKDFKCDKHYENTHINAIFLSDIDLKVQKVSKKLNDMNIYIFSFRY